MYILVFGIDTFEKHHPFVVDLLEVGGGGGGHGEVGGGGGGHGRGGHGDSPRRQTARSSLMFEPLVTESTIQVGQLGGVHRVSVGFRFEFIVELDDHEGDNDSLNGGQRQKPLVGQCVGRPH